LKIALLSNTAPVELDNIQYDVIDNLDTLLTTNVNYDGLVIYKDRFEEADQEKFVEFYNTVNFPVFFWGTENLKDYTFINKNMIIPLAQNR
jgi:hypothetical protein